MPWCVDTMCQSVQIIAILAHLHQEVTLLISFDLFLSRRCLRFYRLPSSSRGLVRPILEVIVISTKFRCSFKLG